MMVGDGPGRVLYRRPPSWLGGESFVPDSNANTSVCPWGRSFGYSRREGLGLMGKTTYMLTTSWQVSSVAFP